MEEERERREENFSESQSFSDYSEGTLTKSDPCEKSQDRRREEKKNPLKASRLVIISNGP
ncbi:hypothetical protein AMTR_s03232p00004580 [Amborella trichopoda]|uniref:Uncharacterized protein n=1 Tax=Amborella trichopoda TaxID=13333 RepID=U5D180_AMBTC|nr:hypothetical protein AMTR_s03232p00004580 [Amborella trichopoda]